MHLTTFTVHEAAGHLTQSADSVTGPLSVFKPTLPAKPDYVKTLTFKRATKCQVHFQYGQIIKLYVYLHVKQSYSTTPKNDSIQPIGEKALNVLLRRKTESLTM